MTEDKQPLTPTPAETAAEGAAIALSAVPVAGGVLSGIANTIISKRQNRRLNQFLVDLSTNLNELQERLNEDFLRTEDFQDLAEDIFSKAAEYRQKDKLDALRAIFLNTVLSTRPSYNETAEMAALIDRWQPRHVQLLRILKDPLAIDREKGNVVGSGGGLSTSISAILKKLLPDWDDDQIDRTWEELYEARIHLTSGTKTMMTDQGIHQLENRLTEFGRKVAEYLTIPS